MSYVIITDSTCDLSEELIRQNDLVVMPMKYQIDGKEYINYPDHHELSHKDFFETLQRVYEAHTSQLNSEEIKACYEKFLKEGKDILAISFSSALSGTYNSIRLAIEELREEYPTRAIRLIDSKCASGGEGLFVLYAAKYRQEGRNVYEAEELLTALRPRLSHWFTVSDIELLRKGGRVSNVAAFAAKMLSIKPVLHVDDEGRLIPVYKKIGRKQAIKQLINQFLNTFDRTFSQTIIIDQANCMEDAEYLKKQLLQELDDRHIPYDRVIIGDIGPVIGSHSGPGTLALFFVGNKR